MDGRAVRYDDILAAQARIRSAVPETPLVTHPALNEVLGCEAWVKLENTTAVGAFKLRGGLNLVAGLSPDQRRRGLCAPTRGNHGQSLAFACRQAEVPCTLFVPEGNNPEKNAAMQALGADLVVSGTSFDDANREAKSFAARTGAFLVHPGREPALIAGVGTLALEMVEQAPGPFDDVLVPVGAGSCICGVAVALSEVSPATRIIGVQAAAAPAMYHAWRDRSCRPFQVRPTLADGLAIGEPTAETLEIMGSRVDDMLLVEEHELADAIRLYARSLRQVAEGAGAAALAGAMQIRERLAGRRIGLILSGGNIDSRVLGTLFDSGDAA